MNGRENNHKSLFLHLILIPCADARCPLYPACASYTLLSYASGVHPQNGQTNFFPLITLLRLLFYDIFSIHCATKDNARNISVMSIIQYTVLRLNSFPFFPGVSDSSVIAFRHCGSRNRTGLLRISRKQALNMGLTLATAHELSVMYPFQARGDSNPLAWCGLP